LEDEFDRLNGITTKIIGCAFKVSNTLGCGFLEKVYENALAYELRKNGMQVEQQYCIQVKYDNYLVGEYFADLLVEGEVLVELKTVKAFEDAHTAQAVNYLKGTGLKLCLLINFYHPKVAIKRIRQDRNFRRVVETIDPSADHPE
jgi:GxxExxY protein